MVQGSLERAVVEVPPKDKRILGGIKQVHSYESL